MNVYNNFENFHDKNLILVLGMFDGIHLGHKKLLNNNSDFGVLTFQSHPKCLLGDETKLILLEDEKIDILNKMGASYCISIKPTKEFLDLSAMDFINLIKEKICPSKIVVGFDFSFGKDAKGNFLLLKDQFENVQVIEKVCDNNGNKISSNMLRNMILKDDFKGFYSMCDYNYFLSGKIIHGNNIGSKNNTPTINLDIDKKKLLPNDGVYITKVFVDNNTYLGVTNVGRAPTFERKEKIVEVHILNFNKNIYNQKVKVEFYKKIRDIKKFESVKELYIQISKDIITTQTFFDI